MMCMATIRVLRAVLCLHHEGFHLFIRLLNEGAFGLASAIISALAGKRGAHGVTIGGEPNIG